MSKFAVRKRLFIALIGLFLLPVPRLSIPIHSNSSPPFQPFAFPQIAPIASYRIWVTLDAETKTLEAHEIITYVNVSQESIPNLVFHLYLNAFRDRSSYFLRNYADRQRGYAWDPEYPGWIKVTGMRLADKTPLVFEEYEDGTLGRATLPEPIDPGDTAVIEVDFQARLPRVFARTGFAGDFFMVGQWFPKLGVWQRGAWNAYPFYPNAEFFADFGDYDVEINLPVDYVTGGVGLLESREVHGDGTQTVRYHAEGVIDFAWTASPHFRQATRHVSGVEILYLYLPEHRWTVKRVLDAAEAALSSYSSWYGPYAYPRLTIVDVPEEGQGAGGMEYPTLITAGVMNPIGFGSGLLRLGFDRLLEVIVMHEVAHQWWQSAVAFNEVEEPWLDEGLTDYSTTKLVGLLFGENNSLLQVGNVAMGYRDMRRLEYLMNPSTAMHRAAWEFDTLAEYAIATYSKPVMSLSTLEGVLGRDVMLEILSTFFERYRFAHPTTEDFRAVVEEIAGQDCAWFFDGLVYGEEVINYTVSAVEEDSVTVTRQGGGSSSAMFAPSLVIPTEVKVTFEGGESITESWDGQGSSVTFQYRDRPAVESAIVDPEGKIAVDLIWSDNGRERQRDLNAWLALASRWLYRIQDIMLIMGGW